MKELSEIKHDINGYHFECRWGGELDIETEIEEARKHCAVVSSFEVPVINKDPHRAIISGRGEMNVWCVRSFLIDYKGWTEPLAGAGV